MAAGLALGIQAGLSFLGGRSAKKAAKAEARARKAMAAYNAKVIRANAKAEADAIEAQSARLTKQQREVFAQQRMSVTSRGGLETGGDLLSLIESAKNMQLDLLELQRQRDIALISGENQANKAIYEGQLGANIAEAQGRAAMTQGILGAVGTIAGGFASGTFSFAPKTINANATLTPSLNTALGRSNSFVTRAMGSSPTFSLTGNQIPSYLRR